MYTVSGIITLFGIGFIILSPEEYSTVGFMFMFVGLGSCILGHLISRLDYLLKKENDAQQYFLKEAQESLIELDNDDS